MYGRLLLNGRVSIRTFSREQSSFGKKGKGRSSCHVVVHFNGSQCVGMIVGMVTAQVLNIINGPIPNPVWHYLRCIFYRIVPFSEHRLTWVRDYKMKIVDVDEYQSDQLTDHAKQYGELVDVQHVWPELPLLVPLFVIRDNFTRHGSSPPPFKESWHIVIEFNNRKHSVL